MIFKATVKITVVPTRDEFEIPNTCLVIEQSETTDQDGKFLSDPDVLVIANTEQDAWYALAHVTSIKQSDVDYDHGSYYINNAEVEETTDSRYGGASLIMVVHTGLDGFIAAGNVMHFTQFMTPEQLAQVREYLNSIWE